MFKPDMSCWLGWPSTWTSSARMTCLGEHRLPGRSKDNIDD
jgi:hypothetical protein